MEISARWISFAGDRRCLYSVRWRLALFGLDERKRMEGRRGRENCVWVLGESDEKKKKKGEKWMYTQVWCSGSGFHKK